MSVVTAEDLLDSLSAFRRALRRASNRPPELTSLTGAQLELVRLLRRQPGFTALVVLTLPVTVLTLGLFLFIINALMFWAAASVLEGFDVRGFGAALLGSLIYSANGVVIESALERLFPKQ